MLFVLLRKRFRSDSPHFTRFKLCMQLFSMGLNRSELKDKHDISIRCTLTLSAYYVKIYECTMLHQIFFIFNTYLSWLEIMAAKTEF